MAIAHVSNDFTAVVLASIFQRPLLEALRPEEQQLLQPCPAVAISAQGPGTVDEIDTHCEAAGCLYGVIPPEATVMRQLWMTTRSAGCQADM